MLYFYFDDSIQGNYFVSATDTTISWILGCWYGSSKSYVYDILAVYFNIDVYEKGWLSTSEHPPGQAVEICSFTYLWCIRTLFLYKCLWMIMTHTFFTSLWTNFCSFGLVPWISLIRCLWSISIFYLNRYL